MVKMTVMVLCVVLVLLTAWFTFREIRPRGPSSSIGEKLVEDGACRSCHQVGSGFRAPVLENLFMKERTLASGEVVVADREYLRESIEDPHNKIVEGYNPIMPSYKGRFEPREMESILDYLQALGKKP